MANDKFNLNARLYQGHDPNTEFNTNSNLFSALRFADGKISEAENLNNAPEGDSSGTQQIISPDMKQSDETTNLNQSNAILGDTGQAGSANSASSFYADPLSSGAGGAQNSDALEGLQSQGAGSDAGVASNSFLSLPTGGPSGSPDPQPIPQPEPEPDIIIPPGLTLADPVVTTGGLVSLEGDPVPLNIGLTTDTQPGVVTVITISGIPLDATLSAGVNNGNGTWTLTPSQIPGLILTPGGHYSGQITLNVTATSSLGNLTASDSENLSLSIEGEASLPNLTVHNATGSEDIPVNLQISASLNDLDGSETLAITISGVPAGAVLSAGTNNGNGTWTLTQAQLANLTITTPSHYSGDFNLSVTATASENNQSVSTSSQALSVHITPTHNAPVLDVTAAAGTEDNPVTLDIDASPFDPMGTEVLTITISNLPAGSHLSAGINNGDGTWTLAVSDLTNLQLIPAHNYSGNFILTVVLTSIDGNDISNVQSPLPVTISGIPDMPTLSVQPASGNEDTPIALNIVSSLNDIDGSETLAITISGVPTGASLSAGTNNGNGIWTLTAGQLTNLTLTPPSNFSGAFNLNVTATSTEGNDHAQISSSLNVTVLGVPDIPTLSVQPASGDENTPIALNISAALTDTDGSEALSVTISGVPAGAVLSAGTNNGNGAWTLTQAQLANLTITPPSNYSGTIPLSITATASENNLTASTSAAILNVAVDGVATTPNLTTSPASGNEDTPIALNIASSLNDTDNSETLSIRITGVPAGAVLSAGTNSGNGIWTLTAGQLTNLTLTPPSNFSGAFNLTVTATASENGTNASTSSSLSVTVRGEADTPSLSAQAAFGNEDTSIALNISAALNDTDGSEVLSILISGIPAGASLSAGLNNGNGSWTLSPSQLAGLSFMPPANFAGILALQVTAISTENNGDDTSISVPLTVTIQPVADSPQLKVSAGMGLEDTPIALSISALLTDNSETLSIRISGVPAGASLSAGINQGNGNWLLTQAQLANLKITPPTNSDADFTLMITATAIENNGTTSSVISNLPVTVHAVADIPTVTASNTSGAKNTAVSVNIGGAVTDLDGSETITYLISGVPDGFSLNHGINNGNNSWTLTPGDLSGLKMISPYNFEGRVYLNAQSVSHDHDGSVAVSSMTAFNVGIGNPLGIQLNLGLGLGLGGIGVGTTLGADVNVGGLLSSGGIVVHEDSIFPIVDAGLLLTLAGSISFLTLSGLPVGVSLSSGVDQGNGQWRLLPGELAGLSLRLPANSDQDFTITISAQLLFITVVLAVTDVHVLGVADKPTLSIATATGTEDSGAVHIGVTSVLTDTDGSETLSFMIKDLPAGFTPTIGINNGNGTWSLTASQMASLSLQPPEHFSGDATFTIVAVSTEREGDSTTHTATGHIHINPVADAPVINPALHSGTEDTPLLLNFGINLSDGDGSEAISSIVVSGLAAGFTLDHATNNGNGTWTIDPANINNVHLHSPSDWSGNTSFTVTATSRETLTGQTASTSLTQNVHIEAAADLPHLAAQNSSGLENHHIGLDISVSAGDLDGSEHLSVVISDVPDHFTFSSGLNNGNGSWSFSEDQLDNLFIIPEENFTGNVHLNVDVFSQDGNSLAVSHTDLVVHVTPDT